MFSYDCDIHCVCVRFVAIKNNLSIYLTIWQTNPNLVTLLCYLVCIKKSFTARTIGISSGFGSPILPRSLSFSLTRLNCLAWWTSKELDTLSYFLKAPHTEITELSSTYALTPLVLFAFCNIPGYPVFHFYSPSLKFY